MPLINPTGFLPADYYTLLALFASNANAQGASLVGVEDSAAHFTGTTVEAVLAELYTDIGTSVGTVTKTSIGLGNVDNTSDVNKPVSTAQQTALNLKANINSQAFTGTPSFPTGTTGVTQSALDNSTKFATTAYTDAAVAAKTLTFSTSSLGADVNMNNTANYFDGPSVAQGTSGTWLASGTVTVTDTGSQASFSAKLWDGTTAFDSCHTNNVAAGATTVISLSGRLTSPAGNIRISVKDNTATTGKILFNQSGPSLDSTITVVRIA